MTSPDSLLGASPDEDGNSNYEEFMAGNCPVSPALVPRILQIVLAGSEVRVQVQTCLGSNSQLERNDALSPAAWTASGTLLIGSGGWTNLLHPDASLASQRFYRVRISR